MNTLVIGYGKIGRIKSFLWKSLGSKVVVYDTDPSKASQIESDGFTQFNPNTQLNDCIVDISTPANQHFKALTWVLGQNMQPKTILIEKPIASTSEEVDSFISLISSSAKHLADKIFVNESYYSSSAIEYVCEHIKKSNEQIKSIEIELSKNRLPDHDNGRFFDTNLDAIGIEVPHMLAILQLLKINLNYLLKSNSRLLIDKARADNQAFVLTCSPNRVKIKLVSNLGNFRHDKKTVKDQGIVRILTICTNKTQYEVTFDPVSDVPRYCSRVSVFMDGKEINSRIIADDHLKKHFEIFQKNKTISNHKEKLGFANALKLSKILIKLRENSNVEFVSSNLRKEERSMLKKEIYDVIRN